MQIPDINGMSNLTLPFDIEWQENGQTRREVCVGRLQTETEIKPVAINQALT